MLAGDASSTPSDDSKVLKEIIEHGRITQRELKYRSGLSKMKVSRILSRFEQRDVIGKKPYGNTNLIIRKL